MESGGSNPISENLRKALEDLRGAGEKATGDVRTRIDSAVARLNEASGQATTKAQEQVNKATEQANKATGQFSGKATDQLSGWREALDKATEDVRVQLAKLAIKAQTTQESIAVLEEELRIRKTEVK